MFDSYDIFRLDDAGEAHWVKTVKSLQDAYEQIEELRTANSSEYVMFGQPPNHKIPVDELEKRLRNLYRPRSGSS
jgi:hypothetical protein